MLVPRVTHKYNECTIDTCPVSASIYGYYPNLAGNALFLVLYVVGCIAHLFFGIRNKLWSFMAAMVLGTICEAFGQAGRIMLHHDPFSKPGFKLQIVCLTIAPAFLAAGIYLMLKHLSVCHLPDVEL